MKKKPIMDYLLGRGRSFKNASEGIVYAVRTQSNAQIHLVITILVILFGLFFKISLTEFCFVLFCIALVWVVEILNTAIEKLVDLCSPEYHPLAKLSKDLSAGAVLISAIVSAIIGLIIFMPRFFSLFVK